MKVWRFSSRSLTLDKTLVMGILNLTPDSFSDGGVFGGANEIVDRAVQMEREGADIIDVGAESTRPGAEKVKAAEQLARILSVLTKLRGRLRIPISIDTTLPEVAQACLAAGAEIINDVSALAEGGEKMAGVIAHSRAGLVLMHRRGDAKTMQSLTHYGDVVTEVMDEMKPAIAMALASGVAHESIVVDPGLGFSKTAEQSFQILARIVEFHRLGFPIMIGPSRKSFIGQVTGKAVQEREFGTAACVAHAAACGVQIVRVHNVSAARDVIETIRAIEATESLLNARANALNS